MQNRRDSYTLCPDLAVPQLSIAAWLVVEDDVPIVVLLFGWLAM